MNNFVSIFIAVLEHLKLLSEDEAKKLAKELHGTTLPDNYEAASRLLKDIYEKHEIKSATEKLKPAVTFTSTAPTVTVTKKSIDSKK